MQTGKRTHKIGIISLGCAKNLVDSEVLMKQLDACQFKLVFDPEEQARLDTVIINTCGFINDAKTESIETILHYSEARKNNKIRNLFVMGCLSERYKKQLQEEIPEVDDFFGVNDLEKIVSRVGGTFRRSLTGERILTTPSHYTYLKIAEGCDRKCSFCSIPLIRGKHTSVPFEDIITQGRSLAAKGVKELNIISQDTTWYGFDLYKKRRLPELLGALSDIRGIEWIRLHYTYPDGFPLEILDVIRERPNICKYIDIPLQHINSEILRSMRRGINKTETLRLIDTIRSRVPGIAVRTTLIAGYPGETQKKFDELKQFVSQSRFDRLGIFTYSHEEDTAAFRLKDSVPEKIKQQRAAELMEIQQSISLGLNREKIGRVFKVIIDREEGDYFIGRSEFDSPEIDNEILVPKKYHRLETGRFYDIRITGAESFDLFGENIFIFL